MTDDPNGPVSPESPVLTLPRRLQKLVLSYLVADVVAAALNLAAIVIVLRALSVEEFGIADLLRVSQWFLGALMGLNLFDSATRFSFEARDDEERRRILGGALSVYLASGLVAAVILFAAGILVGPGISASIVPVVVFWAAVNIPVTNIFVAVSRSAVIHSRAGMYTALVIGQGFFVLLGCYLLVVRAGYGVSGYLIATFAGSLLPGAAGFFLKRKWYKLGGLQGPLRKYVDLGSPATATELIHYGYGLLIRLLLTRSGSAGAVGYYGLAERLQSPLQLVVAAVGRVWLPWLLNEDVKEHRNVHAEVRQLSGFVLITLGVLVIFLEDLIRLLGGARYERVYPLALALLVARWLMFLGDYLLSAGLVVAKQTRYRVIIFVLSYAAAAGTAFIALPRLGLLGVGIAALIASAGVLLGMMLVTARVYPLDHGIPLVLAASIVAILVAIYGSGVSGLAGRVACFAAFLVVLLFTKLLPLHFRMTRKGAREHEG